MNSQAISTASALAEIESMDRTALAARWAQAFDCPAPRHSQMPFLRSALAWHCQMQALAQSGSGDVNRLIRTVRRKAERAPQAPTLAPGTRLLREWKGKAHHVTVLDSGFEYQGKGFKSLTAISREITGMGWSGPLFFGLRK